jgi:hypothetical protein
MALSPQAARAQAHVPSPPAERGAWAIAIALAALGLAALIAVLSGLVGGSPAPASSSALAPPVLVASLSAPGSLAGAGALGAGQGATIVGRPSTAQQREDARRFAARREAQIATRWMEGFYPIYAVAQEAFAVNWLLLASIHMQESAFSTAPGIYRGLNFAHCCGGPMQFNVRNGPPSTWQRVSNSYIYGRRPAAYNHMTVTHPSIYDDFDSIMAAAHLLSADGAEFRLDASAWRAAYDYYGHDLTGVVYADQVLARALGWYEHGFCFDCSVPAALLESVHASYGAAVAQELLAAAPTHRAHGAKRS